MISKLTVMLPFLFLTDYLETFYVYKNLFIHQEVIFQFLEYVI